MRYLLISLVMVSLSGCQGLDRLISSENGSRSDDYEPSNVVYPNEHIIDGRLSSRSNMIWVDVSGVKDIAVFTREPDLVAINHLNSHTVPGEAFYIRRGPEIQFYNVVNQCHYRIVVYR